jgi:hypothetical protein
MSIAGAGAVEQVYAAFGQCETNTTRAKAVALPRSGGVFDVILENADVFRVSPSAGVLPVSDATNKRLLAGRCESANYR